MKTAAVIFSKTQEPHTDMTSLLFLTHLVIKQHIGESLLTMYQYTMFNSYNHHVLTSQSVLPKTCHCCQATLLWDLVHLKYYFTRDCLYTIKGTLLYLT